MKIRGVLCGVVAAVMLTACAMSGAQTGRARVVCPGNSCDVEVRVKMEGGVARLEVNVDPEIPRGHRDVTIVWKLKDSPEWKFKPTSIAPHTTAPTGDKQTTTLEQWRSQITFLNNSAVNYVVENANSQAITLYYNVTVYKKSDETPLTLDPAIFNDGG
jgi:hypothetical protein